MYTIGQLAKASGVTVRTLHYYDELGLLKPTTQAATGYRYYDTSAVVRLQQITALKQLGFSLAKIKDLVASQPGDTDEARWQAVLRMELAAVRAEQERLRTIEGRLQFTLHALDMTGTVRAEDILLFIRSMQPEVLQRREAFLTATFTPAEAAILRALPDLDADDPRTQRWVQLVRELRQNQQDAPDSPRSQALAAQVIACATEFFHGDEALIMKYWSVVRPEPDQAPVIYGLDAPLVQYIDAILNVWDANQQSANTNGETQ